MVSLRRSASTTRVTMALIFVCEKASVTNILNSEKFTKYVKIYRLIPDDHFNIYVIPEIHLTDQCFSLFALFFDGKNVAKRCDLAPFAPCELNFWSHNFPVLSHRHP